MGDLTFDLSELHKAFDFVQTAVPRDASYVLNKTALTALVGSRENKYSGSVQGAMQRTPRANKAAIKAIDPRIIAGVVMKRARAKGERLTRREIDKRIRLEYARRARSVAYTAGPGWSNAAKAFGGRGVKTQKGFAKSFAVHGSGSKSTPSRLVATLMNTAPAASKIGHAALQAALNQTAGAMVEFGQNRIAGTFRKVNAR